MRRLEDILEFNKQFLEKKDYESFKSTKYPYKKMIVFSCMDTRLTQLLPKAMNLNNGDAKIIKNAGATIMHPFGSIMRSIIVAIYELGAEEVFVVGHHECGMSSVNPTAMIEQMKEKGITEETLKTIKYSGIDLNNWLHGFDCVIESVKESVDKIKNHPLIPESVVVHGLIMDPETGELDLIVNGYGEN